MARAAILFDLDGTLVDSIACYEDALRQAMLEIGVPEFTHEAFVQSYHHGQHLDHLLERYGYGHVDRAAVRRRRDELYLAHLRDRSDWIEGAESLLRECGERYAVGLVTGSWRTYVDALDAKLGLYRHFAVTITCDDTGPLGKPHPHGLLLACDRLGVAPELAMYVGDQQFDIDAARAAGMEAHAVRGPISPPQFSSAYAHHASLPELRTRLFGLSGASS